MLKTGKYRALRNIPVGWILQGIHSTDASERIFRLFVEGSILVITLIFAIHFISFLSLAATVVVTFIIVHTLCWFMTGNFWVYILDSFAWMKNPGFPAIISFVLLARKVFLSADCSDTILIYGSMCRSQFHIRSDLDLRVVRRSSSLQGFIALPLALFFRIYSFFIVLPLDLQVVDSMGFLKQQMRPDEDPIIVYCREGFNFGKQGKDFSEVEKNPKSFMKVNQR
jgi:hypothetical protein